VSRIRIDLAYDGSGFRGCARQPDQRTVQGVLEDALSRVCRTNVVTTVAGRTDAGVHAAHQVAHADVPDDDRMASRLGDLDGLQAALDKMCGPEIAIWSVRRAPDSFDARFSAVERRYRYRLCDAAVMDPMRRHGVWHVGEPRLDVMAMEAGGAHLLGEHDFSSFCRRSGDQHLRRRIDVLTVARTAAARVEVRVEGPAFCHQMVRSIVGCLLPVGRGARPPDEVTTILTARDRAAVGQVAPPHGLSLTGVVYPSEPA
jgi:tRNA pseudouridine38-40 synthase